jgi:hypothetical protein
VSRCRLCTTNDREALIEDLAREMWESRRDPELDWSWEECRRWQDIYREHARLTLYMLDGRMT